MCHHLRHRPHLSWFGALCRSCTTESIVSRRRILSYKHYWQLNRINYIVVTVFAAKFIFSLAHSDLLSTACSLRICSTFRYVTHRLIAICNFVIQLGVVVTNVIVCICDTVTDKRHITVCLTPNFLRPLYPAGFIMQVPASQPTHEIELAERM